MRFLGFFSDAPPPLVRRSLGDLDLMLATSSTMLEAAAACLLDGRPLTLDLKTEDDRVNEAEERVRRALLTHFSVTPSEDVSFALALNALVQEAERMGDLAKSTAKVADLARARPDDAVLAPLRALRDRVLEMAADTRRALADGDAEAARTVMAANDALKEETAAYLIDLAGRDGLSGNEGVVLALTARFIGRFGAHLSNVASGLALPYDQLRHAL